MKVGREDFYIVAPAHTPANTGGIVDLAPDFKVEKKELLFAILIAPAVGVAESIAITFAGTWVVGDKITLTLTSNDSSPQKWIKAYQHTVITGATTSALIAAAIAAKITADGLLSETPYTASVAGAVITVAAKSDDTRSLDLTKYTNSSAGTITPVVTAPTISEGQPQDLMDNGVPADKITLASYDTVRITYQPEAPISGVNSVGPISKEIYWYGTVGEGAGLVTLINTP